MVFHVLLKHMVKLQHFTSCLQNTADPLGKHFTICWAHSGYGREMKQCHNTPLVKRVTLHGLFESRGNTGTAPGVLRHQFVRTGSDSDCCQHCLFGILNIGHCLSLVCKAFVLLSFTACEGIYPGWPDTPLRMS